MSIYAFPFCGMFMVLHMKFGVAFLIICRLYKGKMPLHESDNIQYHNAL